MAIPTDRTESYAQIGAMMRDWHLRFEGDLAGMRASFDGTQKRIALPDGVTARDWSEDGLSGQWLSGPGFASDRVVIYMHGGGYTVGSSKSHRHLAAYLAQAAGCEALVLDYRLAPEHPMPAGIEDTMAAFENVAARVGAGRVALAGDSAGGGLALAATAALRDAGRRLPGALVLFSPWADMRGQPLEPVERAAVTEDPEEIFASMSDAATQYLSGAGRDDPRASPVCADLSGFPDLLIQVGAGEVMLRDALTLATARSGADVTLEIEAGAPHVWQWFCHENDWSRAAVRRAGEFLGAKLSQAYPNIAAVEPV